MKTLAQTLPAGNTDPARLVSLVTLGLEEVFREAGRDALEAFIGGLECGSPEVERGGVTYRAKGAPVPKKFLTVFGEIEVARRHFRAPGVRGALVPLDEAWGMAGRYAAPEVVGRVLWTSANLCADAAAEAFWRLCGFRPSASCVRDIVSRDGGGVADMLASPGDGVTCRGLEVPEGAGVLVASFDGANVLLREEGPRKGRPAGRPGLGDGGAKSSYRNAVVGSFSFYQLAEVIDIDTGAARTLPDRLSSSYCARMPEEGAAGFKGEFEAVLGDIGGRLPGGGAGVAKIFLADGARGIWTYAEGCPALAGFHMITDFFHASEHLSILAAAAFGGNTEKAGRWYETWRSKLKYEAGAVPKMLRSVARQLAREKIPRARLEEVEAQVTYFENNACRMDYPGHMDRGWPIGSGPVEAACKTIVKARMCQSGMRWSREGGKNILALRVLHRSEQWDSAWEHYLATRWKDAA